MPTSEWSYLKTAFIAFLCFLTPGISTMSVAWAGTEEEEQIRAVAIHWEAAWNNHDMKALAALFTENADFVNVGARHWKGRAEIEEQHAARLKQFAESTWETKQITVQFLRPDIAFAHVCWAMKGDRDPDGTPRQPREGVFTWVLVREERSG